MKRNRAFTLIEILIVLAILGLMMMAITPVLGERTVKGDALTAFFNDLLKEHYDLARNEGVPVEILGFKGSGNMVKYDGTRISIPDVKSIQSARVNGQNTPGLEYSITVYPDGLCDYFVLETDDNMRIVSSPLLMVIKKEKI